MFTNNNEWSPLGGKDPLKNLAIKDYIPPLLQDVQYWTHTESSNKHKQRENAWKNSLKFNGGAVNKNHHPQREISPQNGINSAVVASHNNNNFHHQKSTSSLNKHHQTRQAAPPQQQQQHDKFMYYSVKPAQNWQKQSPPTPKPSSYQSDWTNEKMKVPQKMQHEDTIALGSHLQHVGKFEQQKINNEIVDIKPIKIHNTTSILMEKLVSPEDVNSLAAMPPIEKSTVAVQIGKFSDPESYVNMVIQGHSRVKTFGNSARDEIGKYLPEIHTVQGPENPIVAYVETFKGKDKKVSVKKLFEFLSGDSSEKK